MDSRRIPTRPLTVKSVTELLYAYDEQAMHQLQQMLAYFGVAPKLERIVWAYLKKEYLRRKRMAEELTYGGEYNEKDPSHSLIVEEKKLAKANRDADKLRKAPPERKPRKRVMPDPPKFTQVVDVCTCGASMVGTVIPTCGKVKYQPIFYKECVNCTRYVETYRQIKRNRTIYTRSEGG